MTRPIRIILVRNPDIALDIDRYGFAIRVRVEDGRLVARMELSA